MSPDRTARHTSTAIAAVCLLLLAVLSGCATRPVARAPAAGPATLPPDAVPRPEPPSRYGNNPFYEVNGKRYEVLASSNGYKERGVASWYGKEFHGRPTSSQEPYDMNAMTAAHKSLPLPTYVRVRNLANGRSVVVRVNDRGPFVDNRLIDLSYAAARRLDMIRDGTSLVEITAIGSADTEPSSLRASREPAVAAPTDTSAELEDEGIGRIFVQVGAFGDIDNARRRYDLLEKGGIDSAFVQEDAARSPTLYRVRIGPIAGVDAYDSLVGRLMSLGISETHLVTE